MRSSRNCEVVGSKLSLVEENERNNVVEGKLGLLYNALVPRELLFLSNAKFGHTLAQKQKNMSKINLHSLAQNRTSEGDDEDEDEEGTNSTFYIYFML